MRSLCTATKSSPRSPQLEKARMQQRRHNEERKKEREREREKERERKKETSKWLKQQILHLVSCSFMKCLVALCYLKLVNNQSFIVSY